MRQYPRQRVAVADHLVVDPQLAADMWNARWGHRWVYASDVAHDPLWVGIRNMLLDTGALVDHMVVTPTAPPSSEFTQVYQYVYRLVERADGNS